MKQQKSENDSKPTNGHALPASVPMENLRTGVKVLYLAGKRLRYRKGTVAAVAPDLEAGKGRVRIRKRRRHAWVPVGDVFSPRTAEMVKHSFEFEI